nr:type IX secretion system sortase PorU [Saprospiraceae bacterium]
MKKSLARLFFIITLTGALPLSLWAQWAEQSVLADGEIYTFAIRETGIYRLDKSFLESIEMNTSLVDIRKLQLFGHPGGPLPKANAIAGPDDLEEIAILVVDGGDQRIDEGDYILFYAESANEVSFDENKNRYQTRINPYSTESYFYLKVGGTDGMRVTEAMQPGGAAHNTSTYTAFQHYEVESNNLLHAAGNANLQGSGQRWLGDYFRTSRSKEFSGFFDLRNVVNGSTAQITMEFAARSSVASTVEVEVSGMRFSKSISRALVSDIEEDYAKFGKIEGEVSWNSNNTDITITYPDRGNNNEGWLDYLALDLQKTLVYGQEQLIFSDVDSWSHGAVEYTIEGLSQADLLWDISDPLSPLSLSSEGGRFFHQTSQGSRFVLAGQTNYLVPGNGGRKLSNQNLHGLDAVDYLLIYHPDFEAAAMRLAEHRTQFSNLRVASVPIEQVYHEFSAGKVDPTAIRNCARMLFERSQNFRYLMLIGDGSFDYKHIYTTLNDESFVPVFETEESMDPIFAFPTDDYYALLSPNEGANLRGALDIAVGRLPVRTADEANLVVNKIITYETDPERLGSWRTNILFVADDEDSGRHLDAADAISRSTAEKFPTLNIGKIYMDAFVEEKTPGGPFNFNATRALNQEIFKGQLLVNYIGHGGSGGWAQERLLQNEDIDKWNNGGKLPLLITATCSFAGYDNPKKITAGEYSLTNPDGGSVALYSTVRAVYAGSNERLTRSVFNEVFKTDGIEPLPIGEILIMAKNANSADTLGSNARKFTLLGDPAMRLALPRLRVRTTSINGTPIEAGVDTIRALSKVSISGEIIDENGDPVSNYTGQIFPTIYDKSTVLKTLGQDGSPERDFELQQNVIFNGRDSVDQGRFTFNFVMPKDINYVYGNGKISYYAENGTLIDARGNFDEIIIGGTSKDAIEDNDGPEIKLYLNEESFVNGGTTDPSPTLFVQLQDESGINVTGNGIGHDLTSVLDNDRQNVIVLNDFYEASLDDFTSGQAVYPLSNLEP